MLLLANANVEHINFNELMKVLHVGDENAAVSKENENMTDVELSPVADNQINLVKESIKMQVFNLKNI